MKVETKAGGDGVACWNRQAILAYAADVDAREQRLGAANPDLVVVPGRVKCYGCEVMELDHGTRCTAVLTRSRYLVEGEVQPRAEDAAGSLAEIRGLVPRLTAEPAAAPTGVVREPGHGVQPEPRPPGLRGLFSRR